MLPTELEVVNGGAASTSEFFCSGSNWTELRYYWGLEREERWCEFSGLQWRSFYRAMLS